VDSPSFSCGFLAGPSLVPIESSGLSTVTVEL
jgi:hypothetical protein